MRAGRHELEHNQRIAKQKLENSEEEEDSDSGTISSDTDRDGGPLPHPALSPQLLPVLAHDWESSDEEIPRNEAPPPQRRKSGPPKGRKKRPETGGPGTVTTPRDNLPIIVQPSRKRIQLPLPPNGRARRLVCSSALDIWCAVTMRGDVQFIDGIEQ